VKLTILGGKWRKGVGARSMRSTSFCTRTSQKPWPGPPLVRARLKESDPVAKLLFKKSPSAGRDRRAAAPARETIILRPKKKTQWTCWPVHNGGPTKSPQKKLFFSRSKKGQEAHAAPGGRRWRFRSGLHRRASRWNSPFRGPDWAAYPQISDVIGERMPKEAFPDLSGPRAPPAAIER